MNRAEILLWLGEADPGRIESLWRRADAVRREEVGDAVHLRGLLEISNHCARACAYCGLRAPNRAIARYRMTADEVLAGARAAVALGYGTVVLQSGEDDGLAAAWVADVVRRIKAETPLAVTLSLGERSEADLAAWRDAGADRYLLRFETANRALYDRIHPPRPGPRSDRLAHLRTLRDLGYEIGSGVMVGIPGQTVPDLADDLETFRALDLDMIGLGPYLAHPATPLGRRPPGGADADQAPNTQAMTCKMLALARLVCPRANIPSTTALATLNPDGGRESGLRCGANVVMPNLTPPGYRALYEIYPGKAGPAEDPATYHAHLIDILRRLGRTAGAGRGDSPRYAGAQTAGAAGG